MPDRDWQKDWELCEKARVSHVEDLWGTLTPFMQVPAFNAYHMQLMREADEALPYWLARVRELEEQMRELEKENTRLKYVIRSLKEKLADADRALMNTIIMHSERRR